MWGLVSQLKANMSVTEFALPDPWLGDLDHLTNETRMPLVGQEIHRAIQDQRSSQLDRYHFEHPINGSFESKDLLLKVSGKMDGISFGDVIFIEEIKSTYQLEKLSQRLADDLDHPYKRQLLTYGYLAYKKFGSLPHLSLCLVDARTMEEVSIDVHMDIAEYESWVERRMATLVRLEKLHEKIREKRKGIGPLEFPFDHYREGQEEAIETIKSSLKQKGSKVLLEGPTGSGKTISVMHPSLEKSLSKGQKLIFTTAKNSQHLLASETVQLFRKNHNEISFLDMKSKSEMCAQEEVNCDPKVCPYAKDYHTKVFEKDLRKTLSARKILSSRAIKKLSKDNEVCPYQVQKIAAEYADVIVADYNYVFSPSSLIDLFAKNGELKNQSKPVLLVDEAHNLASRARDYFSTKISLHKFERLESFFATAPRELQSITVELMDKARLFFRDLLKTGSVRDASVLGGKLDQAKIQLDELVSTYLRSQALITEEDPVLGLFFEVSKTMNMILLERVEIRPLISKDDTGNVFMEMVCQDAAWWLGDIYNAFDQVLAFSATLKPFEFHQKTMGLEDTDLKFLHLKSAFPQENRAILVAKDVSTKYRDREKYFKKISQTILKTMQLKKGCYAAFFPSYAYMNKIKSSLEASDIELIVQKPGMRSWQIQKVLEEAAEQETSALILGVQGGVLAEGVDYKDNLLSGVFVVGPAVPMYNQKRELMREYYEEQYEDGFNYAYSYPAVSKSIQAAGRLIRTPEDKGIIVLFDDRFNTRTYFSAYPKDWQEGSIKCTNSYDVVSEASKFWDQNHAINR